MDDPPRASVAAPAPGTPVAPDDANVPATTAARTERLTLGYVRVARDTSASDLETHSQVIRAWCAENGMTLTTIVHDVEMPVGEREPVRRSVGRSSRSLRARQRRS